METSRFIALVGELLDFSADDINSAVAVFTRVGAVVALLPGFGEQTLPARVRLAAAIAFALIVWPVIQPTAIAAMALRSGHAISLLEVLLAEAGIGLMLGIAVRLVVMALQLTGSIAAQATSVAQIFGAGVTPDPMPAIGNVLTISGITLALAMGLHVKAAVILIRSYDVMPFGRFPVSEDIAAWGVERVASAFALAFALAAPFVIASLIYNLALGAINRAMPQLMVALVGAPAITAVTLFLLWGAAAVLLVHWAQILDVVLSNPFGSPP